MNMFEQGGPKAPKDPVPMRSGVYIMLDSIIEATPRNDGRPSQDIYLEGDQFIDKVRYIGGVTDESMLNMLKSCDTFHKLVHSIGVSVRTHNPDVKNLSFSIQNFGKTKKYESGTILSFPCPNDGTELIITLADYEWNEDDDIPGKFSIEFDNPGEIATASVKLYLHDGYEVPEIAIDSPVEFESQGYKDMIAKSLISMGNNKRIKAAIEKAERGEDVTIAYIGGSITQGAGAKPINTDCYAYKSYLKFKEMFGKDGGDNVHFVKAGVGGTPSELGMIRYERDVLRYGSVTPDIVIVEFAVNDAGDETEGNCYESLCLKILSGENKPGVVLLFSVFVNDWNLQERLIPIGKHYQLPMVSVKDAVVEQFKLSKEEGNIITKRQFFYDIFHPTNDGHTIMADCLSYLFSQIKNAEMSEEDICIDKEPVVGNDFVEVHLLDKKDNAVGAIISPGGFSQVDTDLQLVEVDTDFAPSPQFPYNWMHTESSGSESFKMTICCKNLLLVFKDSGNADVGKADIYVDGQYVKTADPHAVGWTHCNAMIFHMGDTCKEHNVEIKMSQGDEDKKFTILGFGYTK